MIIDELLKFADAQTVTGGTTVVATNVVDTQVARNLGTGRPLYLVVQIVAVVSGGDSSDTFVFSLIGDTVEPIDASSILIAASATITGIANIPAGTKIVIPVPPGAVAAYRYLGVRYAVTADAVLSVDAYLTDDQSYEHTVYADASEGVTV